MTVAVLAAAVGLALPGGTARAQPSDLYRCLIGNTPTCEEITGSLVITDWPCDRFFDRYYGRIAWYPLRCIGPITVAVETWASWNPRPLYVEVVPLTAGADPCANAPGYVVLMTTGGFEQGCGSWQSVGPVDITHVIPVGSLYALRLHFFGGPTGDSPAVDCVSLVATPTAVSAAPWGAVKQLYR